MEIEPMVPAWDGPDGIGKLGPGAQDGGLWSPAMHKYRSFVEFYPFYLSEHAARTTRRLHFLGSMLGLICVALVLVTGNAWWLLIGLLIGYGLAWFAHFVFEKNRPATFRQPLYSFMGDWRMFWDILTGRIVF
jgi:hypothetical protein